MMTGRWQQRMTLLLVGISLPSLLLGAYQGVVAKRRHDRATTAIVGRLSGWHRQISAEVAPEYRRQWVEQGAAVPVSLLKACVVEQPPEASGR